MSDRWGTRLRDKLGFLNKEVASHRFLSLASPLE